MQSQNIKIIKKLQLLMILSTLTLSVTLHSQEISKGNVNFTIREIPTPAVNAFYLARGFTLAQIKPYADTCVYTTTLRNDNKDEDIHYVRKNWFITLDDKHYPIKSNNYWFEQFEKSGMLPSSWIGFRLSQMPEEQIYGANGGWNQGIFSVNVPRGTQFDVTIVWDIKGKENSLTLKGVNCEK
ncbi:hypothetical protein JHD50_05245 [Sulfurimonas sp. MAG313]|nr:hypothetical protein [Sulfurimonas sp. MAG313]MDF1880714.1 hypothetical protein [Sulfurimonas sp. MAG313]